MSRLAGGLLSLLLVLLLATGAIIWQPWATTAKSPTERIPESDRFAEDRPEPVKPAAFDSDRAMKYLRDVCKIGPRISATDGMTKQQELLKKHFEDQGGEVELQKFTARQKSMNRPVDMANLIVRWKPEQKTRVIFCSHYDTRPIADQEADRRKWRDPFVSANDGGSGVALLMELAHHMKDLKLNVGVDFVFFDGEEYVFDEHDKYFFGSEHFAKVYGQGKGKSRYIAAILLDMVGGKGSKFPVEQNSWFKAGPLVESVWKVALDLRCESFQQNKFSSVAIQDDHLALNAAGIPAIDIIDFDYEHWHRLTDTPENCSGEKLAEVARVLSVWVQRLK
jgi:hypothetical protein